MGKFERFEDLVCRQKARIIVNDIYKITSEGGFSKDFSLKDQIRRAANSVMLNIAEGSAEERIVNLSISYLLLLVQTVKFSRHFI